MIHNLTSIHITDEDSNLLSLVGLNYLPRHCEKDEVRISDAHSYIDSYIRRIDIALHFDSLSPPPCYYPTTSSSSLWSPPQAAWSPIVDRYSAVCKARVVNAIKSRAPSHLPALDKAVSSLVKSFRNRSDVLLARADKGLGIVLITPQHYDQLSMDCLRHGYLSNVPFNKLDCSTSLKQILSNYSMLLGPDNFMTPLAKYMLQNCIDSKSGLGYFYILIKVHKATIAGRPIVASYDSVTYFVSKYLDSLLQQFRPLLPSYCASSSAVLAKLPQEPLPVGSVLLCADINSLYPSIPMDFGLCAVRHMLIKLCFQHGINLDINMIMDLLTWTLRNNYFSYNNTIFLQRAGTAMGTPVAVVYADLVMAFIESKLCDNIPGYYWRYIDDSFGIFPSPLAAQSFIDNFNKVCPDINFTTPSIGDKVNFLDLTIYLDSSRRLQTCIYQKPINKFQYLSPWSNHKPMVFRNLVSTELRRYRLACSVDVDFYNIRSLFYQRLIVRGYNPKFLAKLFEDSATPTRQFLLNALNNHSSPHRTKRPLLLVIDREPNSNDRINWHDVLALTPELLGVARFQRLLTDQKLIVGYRCYPKFGSYFSPINYPYGNKGSAAVPNSITT